jgi:hypothetical protein
MCYFKLVFFQRSAQYLARFGQILGAKAIGKTPFGKMTFGKKKQF